MLEDGGGRVESELLGSCCQGGGQRWAETRNIWRNNDHTVGESMATGASLKSPKVGGGNWRPLGRSLVLQRVGFFQDPMPESRRELRRLS